MNLTPGKLYTIKRYNWMLYPDIQPAARWPAAVVAAQAGSARFQGTIQRATPAAAAYWSERFDCHVGWIPAGTDVVLIEQTEQDYLHVLTSSGEVGWLWIPLTERWTEGCVEEATVE